jgi:hypothetical protein
MDGTDVSMASVVDGIAPREDTSNNVQSVYYLHKDYTFLFYTSKVQEVHTVLLILVRRFSLW